MKFLRWILFAFCLVTALRPAGAAAETVYVHSRIAPLMAGPGLGYRRIGELRLGDMLEADRLESGWYHVVLKGANGWVSRLMVKEFPPAGAVKIGRKDKERLARHARIRPSSLASTAAARGLRAERNRSNLRLRTDYEALEKMEGYRVTPRQARSFVMKGTQDVAGN